MLYILPLTHAPCPSFSQLYSARVILAVWIVEAAVVTVMYLFTIFFPSVSLARRAAVFCFLSMLSAAASAALAACSSGLRSSSALPFLPFPLPLPLPFGFSAAAACPAAASAACFASASAAAFAFSEREADKIMQAAKEWMEQEEKEEYTRKQE